MKVILFSIERVTDHFVEFARLQWLEQLKTAKLVSPKMR